jgi:cytochrome b6-f complex iron-sulfur subunit
MSDTKKPSEARDGKATSLKPGATRREFLNEIAGSALGIAGLGSMVVTYRYLSPNVLFEPPTTFRVGSPDLFPQNSVTFLLDQQVYIVRTDQGFYAVSAVCTHLGCITQWKPELEQIACPCHGSKFTMNGTKVEGPAPRPLPHFSISLTPDGELQVDTLEVLPIGQVLKV